MVKLGWLSITPPTGLSGAHSFPKCHTLEEIAGPPQTSWEPSAGRQPSHLCAHHQEERTVTLVPRGWKSTPDAS